MNSYKISELIVGIKHKERFEILDNWGKIVDSILKNEKYFDSKYFPNISQTYTTDRVLFNNETDNYLRVTPHDIIYRHKLETDNFEEEYGKFIERIENCIVPSIISEYEVKDFIRIGIVFSIKIGNNTQYTKLLKQVLNPNLQNVNDVRFSQKVSTEKGKLFSRTNDYINKIYTLSVKEEKEPMLIYDYQYYFNPLKEDFRQCDLDSILTKSADSMELDVNTLLGEIDEEK